jgi:hypothetical protein
VTITPQVDAYGSRGVAGHDGRIRIASTLAKFRHTSPYTSPKGKADISPVGVFVHEFGHVFDFAIHKQFGMKANSPTWDWLDIAKGLRRHGITSYARTCPSEDFAETHRLFVLNPKLLKELSPERYAHFKKMCLLMVGDPKQYRMTKAEFTKQVDRYFRMEWT